MDYPDGGNEHCTHSRKGNNSAVVVNSLHRTSGETECQKRLAGQCSCAPFRLWHRRWHRTKSGSVWGWPRLRSRRSVRITIGMEVLQVLACGARDSWTRTETGGGTSANPLKMIQRILPST